MYVTMNVTNNQGYGPDQVETRMTLADLLVEVENAIGDFGEDAIVVTHESGNRYGASWGKVSTYNTFQQAEDNEDEGDY